MRTLVMVFLCTSAVAQGPRDSWKLKPFDLEAHLTHSLADAPLSNSERLQIYSAIDDETIHDSFTDQERDKEREAVMSSHVGSIALALDGTKQVLVQGPYSFCGTGGCSLWIFVRQGGRLRLALEAGGGLLIVRKTISNGFHDIATASHASAFDEGYRDYRWDGTGYKQVDCYWTKYPRPDEPDGAGNGAKPPLIVECP